jgi:AraC-like DNA-binding protein
MDDLTKRGLKKSGFEGEQEVVLPGPVAAIAARHPLLRGLRVTDAGYYPRASRHGILRSQGARGAVLILCREGAGWVRFGHGPRRAVHPGEAVLIAPRQTHAYGASLEDPWTIQWSHFEGDEVPDWWRVLGLSAEGGVLASASSERLDLGRVHERLGDDLPSLLAAAAALRWSLANLRATSLAAQAALSSRRSVEKVGEWMSEHRSGKTNLTRLARMASLSPSHFSTLFRERFGYAPMDYFLRLKIQRAAQFLLSTEWPIARVAEESGFPDALYFSRRFRVIMGHSPRGFRAQFSGDGRRPDDSGS